MPNQNIPFTMSGEHRQSTVVDQLKKLITSIESNTFEHVKGGITINRYEANGKINYVLNCDIEFTIELPKPTTFADAVLNRPKTK